MDDTTHTSDTRMRRMAATTLTIGVLSLIIATIMQWMLQPTSPAATPADVAAQFPAAWNALGLISVFGPIAWLAAMPAIMRLTAPRGRMVTVIGGALTALGLAVGIGHLALFFGLFGTIAGAGLDAAAVQHLMAGSDADLLTTVLLIVFLVAFAVGPIVLTVGLRIGRAVPVWVPVAALVTAAASFFGGPIAGIVQLLALIAVWAPVAGALLRRIPSPAAAAISAGESTATRR
nr:hypothetical protein [Microbacterium bovistercoris]